MRCEAVSEVMGETEVPNPGPFGFLVYLVFSRIMSHSLALDPFGGFGSGLCPNEFVSNHVEIDGHWMTLVRWAAISTPTWTLMSPVEIQIFTACSRF